MKKNIEINAKIFKDFMNLRQTSRDFKTVHDTPTHFKRLDETFLDSEVAMKILQS
jgi:hypothetical protein